MFCTEKFSCTVLTNKFSSLFIGTLIETVWTFVLLIFVWRGGSSEGIIAVLIVWGYCYGGSGCTHRVSAVGLEDLGDGSRETWHVVGDVVTCEVVWPSEAEIFYGYVYSTTTKCGVERATPSSQFQQARCWVCCYFPGCVRCTSGLVELKLIRV